MKETDPRRQPDKLRGECDAVTLSQMIVKAMHYAGTDAETSLMHARKSAEAICSTVFAREIGEPKNNRLDKLIELLSSNDKVPERIKLPLRVIQQYGNYAAHFQTDNHPIDRAYIDPCLSALIHVTNWYFHEYLESEVPTIVAEANNEFEPLDKTKPPASVEIGDHEALAAELAVPRPLRPYQWQGISFLARSQSALLADEMGLGKTVQAIIALTILFRASVSSRAIIALTTRSWDRGRGEKG